PTGALSRSKMCRTRSGVRISSTGACTVRILSSAMVSLPPASALLDRHDLAPLGSDVLCTRPDQPVVLPLLEHVRRPAGHTCTGEDVREEVHLDAERVVDRRAEEVHVRVDLLAARLHLARHHLLYLLGDVQPARVAATRTQLARQLLEDRSPRVERAVDAVAEAHDLLAAAQRLGHPRRRVLGPVDLEQHAHDTLVRAAV